MDIKPKYKYFMSCIQYVGGNLSQSYLWRCDENNVWELSGNTPNDWTPYDKEHHPSPIEMFPIKADWLTKKEAKSMYPKATIV